jgi:predicted ATPase
VVADRNRRPQAISAARPTRYALLAPAERHLFAELAVFAGGWSLEAAEHVCRGGELESAEVLRLLGNLVDQSLVIADLHEQGLVVRYRLLETMREYAAESLADAGRSAAARDRHLDWYVNPSERVPLQRFDEHHGAECLPEGPAGRLERAAGQRHRRRIVPKRGAGAGPDRVTGRADGHGARRPLSSGTA